MKKTFKRVMYIEQKTEGNAGLDDRGPAVIAEVTVKNRGATVIYKDRTFRRIHGGGTYGNYRCVEDRNEYWISGVKRKGSNRQWAGSGAVRIEVPEDMLPSE